MKAYGDEDYMRFDRNLAESQATPLFGFSNITILRSEIRMKDNVLSDSFIRRMPRLHALLLLGITCYFIYNSSLETERDVPFKFIAPEDPRKVSEPMYLLRERAWLVDATVTDSISLITFSFTKVSYIIVAGLLGPVPLLPPTSLNSVSSASRRSGSFGGSAT